MPQWYVRAESALARFLLAAITILVFIAAVSRTIGHPVIWSDDMAQLLFVWLCVFGANIAMRNRLHMAVDALVKRLPGTQRWLLELLNAVLVLGFLGTLAVSGYKLTMLNWQRVYGDSGISYAWVTIAIPAGCLLMCIEVVLHVIRSLRRRTLVFFPDKPAELDRAHSQLG